MGGGGGGKLNENDYIKNSSLEKKDKIPKKYSGK